MSIRQNVRVHPVFLLGVAIGLVAFGALLGATLFAQLATLIGTSVVVLALEWIVLALITIIIGIWRSFDELG